jgi:hypothetical protein
MQDRRRDKFSPRHTIEVSTQRCGATGRPRSILSADGGAGFSDIA